MNSLFTGADIAQLCKVLKVTSQSKKDSELREIVIVYVPNLAKLHCSHCASYLSAMCKFRPRFQIMYSIHFKIKTTWQVPHSLGMIRPLS